MDHTGIKAGQPTAPVRASDGIQTAPPAVVPVPVLRPPKDGGAWAMVKKVLAPFASLRLTVVLFVLGIILVFFGTLAMIDEGIHTVEKGYFRSFWAWIPLQLLVQFGQRFFGLPEGWHLSKVIGFPFPGGWTLAALLLVNLLAAHFVRFKLSWKRSGILILHAGLIILLVGELITGVYQVEGRMQIFEGEQANYAINTDAVELAIVDPSTPDGEKVVVIPGWMLRKESAVGGTIDHPELPFKVLVHKNSWLVNSLLQRPSKERNDFQAMAEREVSGTESRVNMPAVHVTLLDKDSGKVLVEDYLASLHLIPVREADGKPWLVAHVDGDRRSTTLPYQPVKVGDKEYDVSLRFQRSYKDYSIHLIDFRFDRYPGTEIARNFSSEVRLLDPKHGEDRTVTIAMNEPLRYRGETFFQASFDEETEHGTVLQVVRNPAWTLPYLACLIVSLGMLIHFGINLQGFLARSMAA